MPVQFAESSASSESSVRRLEPNPLNRQSSRSADWSFQASNRNSFMMSMDDVGSSLAEVSQARVARNNSAKGSTILSKQQMQQQDALKRARTRVLQRSNTRAIVARRGSTFSEVIDREKSRTRALVAKALRRHRGSLSRNSLVVADTILSHLTLNPFAVFHRWKTVNELKFASLDSSSPLGAYLSKVEIGRHDGGGRTRPRSHAMAAQPPTAPVHSWTAALTPRRIESRRLARACQIKTFKAGQSLPDSPFYVILEGDVKVVDYAGAVLCTRKDGAFFTRRAGLGLVAAKGVQAEDMTDLVCEERSKVLLVMSDGRLETFYEQISTVGREGYDAIISSNLATSLSEVPFIKQANVDAASLRKLGELCSYLALSEGEYIFEQGERATDVYIILKGSAEVVINEGKLTGDTVEGASEEVGGLIKHVGETFGVSALVLGTPTRQYGMIAAERSLYLVISEENFPQFMATHPNIEPAVMMMTKRFLIRRYSMMQSSIFHAFTDEELERAAVHATFKKIKKDETLFTMGEKPLAFYYVSHGLLSRDYKDGSAPQHYKVGTYLGEIGVLLRRTTNLSTVIAVVDSTLLTISKEDWGKVVSPSDKLETATSRSSIVAAVSREVSSDRHGKRDLQFNLQLDLLIKLQRSKASLDALLMHPETEPLLFGFSEKATRGGLRPFAYYLTFDLLHRVKLAKEQSFSIESVEAIEEFLMEQVHILAQLVAQRPCPAPAEAIPHVDQIDGRVPEGLPGSLACVCELERRLITSIDNLTMQPTDLEPLLSNLAKEYTILLKIGHELLARSDEYEELLQAMGAYADDVVERVSDADLEEISSKVLSSTAAQTRAMALPPTARLGTAKAAPSIQSWSSSDSVKSSTSSNEPDLGPPIALPQATVRPAVETPLAVRRGSTPVVPVEDRKTPPPSAVRTQRVSFAFTDKVPISSRLAPPSSEPKRASISRPLILEA